MGESAWQNEFLALLNPKGLKNSSSCLTNPRPSWRIQGYAGTTNQLWPQTLWVSALFERRVRRSPHPFWPLEQHTIDWVAYKQHTFLSHSSQGWELQDRDICRFAVRRDSHLPTVSSQGCRDWGGFWGLSYKCTNLLLELSPRGPVPSLRPTSEYCHSGH